jgi:hypothetical protein
VRRGRLWRPFLFPAGGLGDRRQGVLHEGGLGDRRPARIGPRVDLRLLNWARAAAALKLMDAYAQEHGWLKPDGEPRGFARGMAAPRFSEIGSEPSQRVETGKRRPAQARRVCGNTGTAHSG